MRWPIAEPSRDTAPATARAAPQRATRQAPVRSRRHSRPSALMHAASHRSCATQSPTIGRCTASVSRLSAAHVLQVPAAYRRASIPRLPSWVAARPARRVGSDGDRQNATGRRRRGPEVSRRAGASCRAAAVDAANGEAALRSTLPIKRRPICGSAQAGRRRPAARVPPHLLRHLPQNPFGRDQQRQQLHARPASIPVD